MNRQSDKAGCRVVKHGAKNRKNRLTSFKVGLVNQESKCHFVVVADGDGWLREWCHIS